MEGALLRAPALLCDLKKFIEKENAVALLTALYEITSSSSEEMEFLCKSKWILLIMYFLDSDTKLANISLKILANASKKHEKVRTVILNNNIFHILGLKLRNETDFSQRNIILYSALMVLLVQGNHEAQNQMRLSGCLSSLIYILNSILDEADFNPPPFKNTELIIYAIIASHKNPRHVQNQTEIGWITPKILKFLEKSTVSHADQLQLVKCFWFFLKSILDQNEVNQHIFLKSSGLSVIFRSIQEVAGDRKTGDLLVKMTGILLNLKSHKEFLQGASNYCPVMILCSLLETCNSLVIQRVIIFLDSLTLEFPQTLQIMKNKDILRRVKNVKMSQLKSETTIESFQNIWHRLQSFTRSQEYSVENFLKRSLNCQELTETSFLKNHFCVVHGYCFVANFDAPIEFSLTNSEKVKAIENKVKNQKLTKIKVSGADLNFHKKELRQKEKNLKKIVANIFSHLLNKNSFNINIVGGKMILIFRKFLSFFRRYEIDDFENFQYTP